MLTVIYGPMFSGKTEYLLKVAEELTGAGKAFLILKPAMDNRYSEEEEIISHNGLSARCELVEESNFDQALAKLSEVAGVLVDEAQFFRSASLVEFIGEAADRLGKEVVVTGLNLDYRREPFGAMAELIERADETVKLTGKCYQAGCGAEAEYTVRTVLEDKQVVVGASEMYAAACEKHYYLLDDLADDEK